MIYESFTKSEKLVADKLLDGLTNEEIASALHCSIQAVKFHTTKLFRKAGVKNARAFIAKVLTERYTLPKQA